MRVCAIVVTYNRQKMLAECLDALYAQVQVPDGVLVIDNASTDGTADFLLSYPGIHVVRMERNTGGAGGFAEGVRRAYELGFDWLWLMDDDAEPDPCCLQTLCGDAQQQSAGFYAPCVIHKSSGVRQSYHHKARIDRLLIRERYLEHGVRLEANAFVGVLIPRDAVKAVGFPDASFFLWFDDTEYTYRITRLYQSGRFVDKALMYHKDTMYAVSSAHPKHLLGLKNRIKFYKKIASPIGYGVLMLKTLKHVFLLWQLGRGRDALVLVREFLGRSHE